MPVVPALDYQSFEACQPSLDAIKKSLSQGGVIGFPTDTFYGLGADPFNSEAVEKLFHLKRRPPTNPILVLIHDEYQLDLFTSNISEQARNLIKNFWPGPLTVLFSARDSLPDALTAGTYKIGVRLPGSKLTRKLLEKIGHPLTATSANLSEGNNPSKVEEIPKTLADQLEFIIDGGPSTATAPSTVVDADASPLRIIREGAISPASIQSIVA
ncbi:MAG: threonylcarbamoyl-AMP synthase [Candidatus Nitronauta litoralis]|uniref:L-threonylcarbamoyladenylate synthase n=1 Tax=Candidatus Nitronauta litoralis TaxID=2705533 RepID=A0A7T0BXN0_9BACT|nr:MAG: threonylcarbamoyl-AMP synthase [Candidatus Nitronauta litoralis]